MLFKMSWDGFIDEISAEFNIKINQELKNKIQQWIQEISKNMNVSWKCFEMTVEAYEELKRRILEEINKNK